MAPTQAPYVVQVRQAPPQPQQPPQPQSFYAPAQTSAGGKSSYYPDA